jgi:glycosyltransferase involved in cell wall biosynthesis
MIIVLNALSSRIGGGPTYLTNLLRHLDPTDDLTVHVFAPRGIDVPFSPHIRQVRPRWPTENPILRTLWEVVVLPGYLRRHKADVLFCPGGVVNTRVPEGCKVVTMFRNMMPFDSRAIASMAFGLQRIRVALLRPVLLRSLGMADFVIFVSEHGRSVISALIDVKNSCVIHHGTGDEFRTAGKSVPWPCILEQGTKYLLYVSRFLSYKNHLAVAAAYARLPLALRKSHKLVFVGRKEGREMDAVSNYVAAQGLSDHVIMTGDLPHAALPSIYHHAELIIFASSCENCPNILIESLGSGRPVLSSNVMPMPEIGGDTLRYFSPFDPADIAAAIENVLEDPDITRELAAAACERSKGFDVKSNARKTWQRIRALGRPD